MAGSVENTIQFSNKHKGIAIGVGVIILAVVSYKIATKMWKRKNDILIAKQQTQINGI